MTLLHNLALLGLGSVALWLGTDKMERVHRDKDVAAQRAELQEVRRQLQTVEQELRATQSRVELREKAGADPSAAPVAAAAPAPIAAAPPPAPIPAARPEAKSKPPTVVEMQAGLENALYGEAEDANWSSQAERLVRNGMERTLGEGARVASVRCGSSMCRIETTHRERAQYEQFLGRAMNAEGAGPWNGAFFSSLLEGGGSGEVTAVSYLAREGRSFPAISGR